MAQNDPLLIDFRSLPAAGETRCCELDDAFFKGLEQEEITGGNVTVSLKVREAAGDIYDVTVKASGQVRTLCDRCLDEVSLPIEAEETLRLAYDDRGDITNPDVIVLDPRSVTYDTSWNVYEIIATALPLERVHPDGKCDPDMTRRISGQYDNLQEEDNN